jgi:hypothetical protein
MEEENEKHTETVHTMKNNETDTPNSPEALDSNESGTENGSDTEEETFILNDYELVGDSTSEIEDGEEEVFYQDNPYIVLETQFNAATTTLSPAPNFPQSSSPSTDIDLLMASSQPKEEGKEDDDEEEDILEELMFGPSKKKEDLKEKERHCKTCTCFEN